MSRTRLAVAGGWIKPHLAVGFRHDGGDGLTGMGAAVAGGVRYVRGRLTLETRGRTLVVHEGELEEWGVSGSVGVAAGHGLSFNLGTGYGATGSGLTRLWDQGLAGRSANAGVLGLRLGVEVGYGLAVAEGLVTPYGGVDLDAGDARNYRLGDWTRAWDWS